jgi:serine-type D-Ala-D-Ala carboxypeptidase/endopeptidase (penicillin-binding protein 4)
MKYPLVLAVILLGASNPLYAAPDELPLTVRAALEVRKVPDATLSVFVQDVESGEVLLQWLDDQPRNPASTIKLLTTLVALDMLGPTYRWKTDVFALGEIRDGRLDGDLLLKGYGDPFLVTDRVWQLQRLIRSAGIDEIDGDLLIDDSYFAVGDYDPSAFDSQPLRAYNVAPNALLMNYQVVRYWFEPDFAADSVKVRLDPPLDNLLVRNRLDLATGRCSGYQRGIAITANDAVDEVTFSGSFPSGCSLYAMDRVALSHNEYVFGLFRSLWRESGGVFDGSWRNTVVAEDAEPLVTFTSISLAEVIARVNKHSNNVMARQLLYTLSAEELGPPGTEAGGRAVIQAWLQDKGLLPEHLYLDNGAGLSRETRVTAANMGAMLAYAWRQPYMPEYLASMSLSGLDGTLSRRFRDSELVGRAHMKTGSMDHVTAIAGYLQARSGRRFVIVALQNYEDIHRGPGREVQEALLRWVYEH